MPLQLNYEYKTDTKQLIPASGQITNESVYAKDVEGEIKEEPQGIKMTFMGLDDTTQSQNIKYVDSVEKAKAAGDNDKVLVPFGLVINRGQKSVQTIPLSSMKDNYSELRAIEIGPKTSIDVEIGKIGNQEVANSELLNNGTGTISHNMKLRFEYAGK